ncbi:MAG: hypothetical protein ACQERS_02660 [Bacteroidota bacterium]
MERIIFNNDVYTYHNYSLESEFEKEIAKNAYQIFGFNTVYIDIKKKIGKEIATIPDGYLLDFTFKEIPRLYIIENELSSHDPYKHIGSQILKFAISYKATGRKIIKYILDYLIPIPDKLKVVEDYVKESRYRNIDELLDRLVFETPIAAIVVIDKSTIELENVLSQLTIDTDILEFQTFIYNNNKLHKFIPFNTEVREATESNKRDIDPEELDTIVVSAQEEGFNRVFLGQDSWYAIRISASMLDRIKFIAAYQVAPVSAITYIAEVDKIEKYQDTNKYIVYFKESAKEIEHIKLDRGKKGLAPQAPRYTNYDKLSKAKKLSDIF